MVLIIDYDKILFYEERKGMSKVLDENVTSVYASDGYGGIAMLELDWDQDIIWERGELNDAHESIEDHFINKTDKWYETLIDCVNELNEFTEIELP